MIIKDGLEEIECPKKGVAFAIMTVSVFKIQNSFS